MTTFTVKMATSMRAAARSAKLLQFSQYRGQKCRIFQRNYLSSAYPCHEEWTSHRRADPLLQIADKEQFFVDTSMQFSAKSKFNLAFEVDVFVNVVEGAHIKQEVESIIKRLRRSKHTVNTLPSTACAAVRYFLSIGEDQRLVELLEDRFNYGLFPDTFTINYLMDYFLTKEGRELEAAKVATHLMLQEDPGNEISRILGFIACVKYLSVGETAASWLPSSTGDKTENQEEEEEEELEYVRVPHLLNFYFDHHFDLTDPDLIMGKTLLHFARHSNAGVIRDNARLLGLARFACWDELRNELSNAKEICADTKQLCLKRLTEAASTEDENGKQKFDFSKRIPIDSNDINDLIQASQRVTVPEWLIPELEKVKVNQTTFLSLLEGEFKNLAQQEQADIQDQKAMFAQWVKGRKATMDAKTLAIDRVKRIELLREKKKELVEKEELYYAFENWNKLEMMYTEAAKDVQTEVKVEDYVPPEVKKRAQNKLKENVTQ